MTLVPNHSISTYPHASLCQSLVYVDANQAPWQCFKKNRDVPPATRFADGRTTFNFTAMVSDEQKETDSEPSILSRISHWVTSCLFGKSHVIERTQRIAHVPQEWGDCFDYQQHSQPKSSDQSQSCLSNLKFVRTEKKRISCHMNRSKSLSIARDLKTVANHLHRGLRHVRVQSEGDKQTVKVRNWIEGFFYSLYSKDKHTDEISTLINGYIPCLNRLNRKFFVKETGEPTELFIAVHLYNQCVLSGGSLIKKTNLKLVDNPHVPELFPVSTTLKGKVQMIAGDQPEVVKERRFLLQHHVRRYPGDEIDHSAEANSIFISTQNERLLSAVGYVIEQGSRFFGYQMDSFQKFHYRNKGEADDQIYCKASPIVYTENQEPTSYWLGHASLLLNLPLRSSNGKKASFNVITDPVEGDLNRVFYPRQTEFARSMESLPASHIYLLSHNHLDHFDSTAISKLLPQQPIMIVPKGDGYRFTELGFNTVIELDWWEKQTIELKQDGEIYEMRICATPSRHWAGQGPCGGHEASFVGYVIEGVEGGDVYFAGDTARLSEDHIRKLRENFNIKWNFQPGGPDEVRKDMESTHQASVDALWMHFNLLVKKEYSKGMSKEVFLKSTSNLKTIFMHTMTFKLGNLHLSDTHDSVEKVLLSLENQELLEGLNLKSYERQVYNELVAIAKSFQFSKGKTLSSKDVVKMIRDTVALPKIGSRIGLKSDFIQSDLFGKRDTKF